MSDRIADPEAAPGLFDGYPVDLSGSALVATVPGGRIRIVSGGGITVEPNVTAPSVYQIVQAIAAHKHAVPNARELAEEIRALWSPAPGDVGRFTVEASERLVADLCRIAVTDPSEGVQHALDVIEKNAESYRELLKAAEAEVARLKEAQRADGEVMYANGDEITTLTNRVKALEAIVEAAEERIAALLRLDAATDNLHQADEVLSLAHDAVDAATEAEIETAKALNLAKAKVGGGS